MKIVLHAFNKKLSGVMEVPEETGHRFRLALMQPIQFKSTGIGKDNKHPMMDSPINTICEFEWDGGTYAGKDHEWDGARVYQLVNIEKN